MAEASLAVTPLAKCAVPAHFTLLGQAQGLPGISARSSGADAQLGIAPAALRLSGQADHGRVASMTCMRLAAQLCTKPFDATIGKDAAMMRYTSLRRTLEIC